MQFVRTMTYTDLKRRINEVVYANLSGLGRPYSEGCCSKQLSNGPGRYNRARYIMCLMCRL